MLLLYTSAMGNKPPYTRESNILEIVIAMAARPQGITLKEIQDEYGVSRNTAERWKDSILNIFPQVDELPIDDVRKHYGFINYSITPMISFTSDDLTCLSCAKNSVLNKELEHSLGVLFDKLTLLAPKAKVNETEICAVRQRPLYKANARVLNAVKEALATNQLLEGMYMGKKRLLEPLGLVYGRKTYLIAYNRLKDNELYSFLLYKFDDITVRPETFTPSTFRLEEWVNESFGIWHDKILKVKLQFDAAMANKAANYLFHPTQKGWFEKDGTYIVKFKASGPKEILFHLFTWGKHVKILSPVSLRKQYLKEIKAIQL